MSANGQVQVDSKAGSLYVRLNQSAVHQTRTFGDFRMVDYDADGRIVGVEFLQIDGGIDLDGLPEHQRLQTALVAHGLAEQLSVIDPTD